MIIHFYVECHFNNQRTLELMRLRPVVGLPPDKLFRKSGKKKNTMIPKTLM